MRIPAAFQLSKNKFFDKKDIGLRASISKLSGYMPRKALKFQSFCSTNTGNPRPLREKAFLGKGLRD